MTKDVIPWILRAYSALHSIDTSILVFYHQDRQGRTDIRLRPRPAWPVRPPAPPIFDSPKKWKYNLLRYDFYHCSDYIEGREIVFRNSVFTRPNKFIPVHSQYLRSLR